MSLNEIELLVRRAALGRGLPYGLAEEAGAAAAWLAAAGLDGGLAIADALDGVREGCAGRGAECACWGGGSDAPAAVACIGPSVVDRLALDALEAMTLRLDVPLVLVGMIGARISELARPLRLGFAVGPAGEARVLLDPETIMVSAPTPQATGRTRDAHVMLAPGLGDLDPDAAVVYASGHLQANRRRAVEDGVAL
ncbi:MAG: DUF3726 domain-containing protein, partial [Geminicoccaceae bacterium]|nr:DUF3726 domain-containing protein [Geminicoccaceae bacterium]